MFYGADRLHVVQVADHGTNSLKAKEALHALNRNRENLNSMVSYCDEQYECRRRLQLRYFGENFDAEKCGGTCDNCKAGRTGKGVKTDVTGYASAFASIVAEFGDDNKPLTTLTKIFRGSMEKVISILALKHLVERSFRQFSVLSNTLT